MKRSLLLGNKTTTSGPYCSITRRAIDFIEQIKGRGKGQKATRMIKEPLLLGGPIKEQEEAVGSRSKVEVRLYAREEV